MAENEQLSRREFVQRSIAFTAVVGGGATFLAACGGDGDESAAGKLKGKLAAHEFNLSSIPNQQAFDALDTIGRLLNIDTVKLSYDGDSDKELAQIDQLGTRGVTAMETLILDNGITRQVALACVRNDIYMSTRAQVGQWILPSEEGIDWHYQCLATPPAGAYVLCTNMFKKVGGSGNFVHLQGVAGSSTDAAKTKFVDRALEENPGMKLVARQRADYDREKARVTLDTILTSVNNNVDVVYCQNDDMALGAAAVLRERGLNDTLVAGADAIPEVIDEIIARRIYGTEAIAPPWLAGYCMIQALDAANGHRPDPIEGLMQMDLLIVDTAESARAYKNVIAQGSEAIDYLKFSRILHPDDWDPQWPIRHFEPDEFWAENQGVAKPSGYELPSDYTDRVDAGGYDEIDKMYLDHVKSFPFKDVVSKSSARKTAFEQLYGVSYSF